MPWKIILRYSGHALLFGLITGALWLVWRLIANKRPLNRRDGLVLLFVVYVAMVLEIIGLRLGLQSITFIHRAPAVIPLRTTLAQWQKGPGHFVYHVAGNLVWFVPLGILLPRLKPGVRLIHALVAGLALSACVESLQWLLGTGMPDIDDALLNALGAGLGYLANRIIIQLRG